MVHHQLRRVRPTSFVSILGRTLGRAFQSPIADSFTHHHPTRTISTLPRTAAYDITAGLRRPTFSGTAKADDILVDASVDASTGSTAAKESIVDIVVTEGNLAVARLPPRSRILARVGSVVGMAASVDSRFVAHPSIASAISRATTLGNFYVQEFWTTREAGDVVLAPQKPNAVVAALDLAGGIEYIVRRDAWFGATEGVRWESGNTKLGLATGSRFAYRVSGTGTLLLSTPSGTLHRVVLAAHEEYLVAPRHLVAWEAILAPEPEIGKPDNWKTAVADRPGKVVVPSATGSGQDSATRPATKAGQGRSWAEWTNDAARTLAAGILWTGRAGWAGLRSIGRMAIWRGSKALAGDKGLYRLRGPGEFYISSRTEKGLLSIRRAGTGQYASQG
ncbi:mitochondrial biogenesis AIM24-domain-containing protein [Zopfochytrium polystomum]|nr:mitochondrial biogenesis AIM24-domain-containing protein [Zopfochytrium polystomum]